MKFKEDKIGIYAITDRRYLKGKSLEEAVEEVLKGGVLVLQLREKDSNYEEFLREAKSIKKLCDKYGAGLIINDNINITKEVKAAGVHIGQDDIDLKEARKILGDEYIIGVTARTVSDANRAEKDGADYLGVGAVFGTRTKGNAKTIGVDRLGEVANSVNIPVVAIGGIDEENMAKLKGINISGMAMVSTIFDSKNIEVKARGLVETFGKLMDR